MGNSKFMEGNFRRDVDESTPAGWAAFNLFTPIWVGILAVGISAGPTASASAALLFALVNAPPLRSWASGPGRLAYEAFLMLAFRLNILATAFMSRNAAAPSALLEPHLREER